MKALVTGGAGFIGSHLVEALLAGGHTVRVLDDLSAGSVDNVAGEVELMLGDVSDEEAVRKAVDGVELVFHLAAHRAVLRSVEQPLVTDTANVHGTLTVLKEAADAGVRRVVSASSSSVYGGAAIVPTPETAPLVPRSPYAVSKLAGEHYCRVFAELFAMETMSVRFFNVFGPRQSPQSAYAAVVPLFTEALLRGQRPVVHGDGRQSRDFTYIDDTIAAVLAAATAPAQICDGRVLNVAAGGEHSLLEMLEVLGRIIGVTPDPVHVPPRAGDVHRSQADISAARRDLGYEPRSSFEDGLTRVVRWAEQRLQPDGPQANGPGPERTPR